MWGTKRGELYLLAFSGFAINYMVRVNLNIALVSMVKAPQNPHTQQNEPFCSKHNENNNNITAIQRVARSSDVKVENVDLLWDEYEQGLVLGAFYWGHWSTQIAGGVLSQKYGTRAVFGLSQLVTSMFALLVPLATVYGHSTLVALRVLQGIASGFVWPSMHTLVGRWIPPNERSKFVTAYLGSSFGAAITYPGCGLIQSWFGWEAVFYITGLLGVVWFLAWWSLVHDTPQQHPTISQQEKAFIEHSLGRVVYHAKTLRAPWSSILRSQAVWVCLFARWGSDWGLFSLMTHAPTYLNHVHGIGMKMTGVLAGFPHLCRLVFALIVSWAADKLLVRKLYSPTTVRKLATALCCLGQGVCILGLAAAGCDATMAVIFLTMATTLNGAISAGPLASFVDISPNYAGVLLGVSGMVSVLPGFLSPTIAGLLTYQNHSSSGWSAVFLVVAVMVLLPGLVHVIFSSSELQSWNNPANNQASSETAKRPVFKPLTSSQLDIDT